MSHSLFINAKSILTLAWRSTFSWFCPQVFSVLTLRIFQKWGLPTAINECCFFVKVEFTFLCVCALFSPLRDMYHGIGPLDPERLNVFRTVKEITGEIAASVESPWKKKVTEQNNSVTWCAWECVWMDHVAFVFGKESLKGRNRELIFVGETLKDALLRIGLFCVCVCYVSVFIH